ncbi:hypothetical protein BJ741DRAFT_638967, partial [Chytriomyces cf. hyalinus JEL632]
MKMPTYQKTMTPCSSQCACCQRHADHVQSLHQRALDEINFYLLPQATPSIKAMSQEQPTTSQSNTCMPLECIHVLSQRTVRLSMCRAPRIYLIIWVLCLMRCRFVLAMNMPPQRGPNFCVRLRIETSESDLVQWTRTWVAVHTLMLPNNWRCCKFSRLYGEIYSFPQSKSWTRFHVLKDSRTLKRIFQRTVMAFFLGAW